MYCRDQELMNEAVSQRREHIAPLHGKRAQASHAQQRPSITTCQTETAVYLGGNLGGRA